MRAIGPASLQRDTRHGSRGHPSSARTSRRSARLRRSPQSAICQWRGRSVMLPPRNATQRCSFPPSQPPIELELPSPVSPRDWNNIKRRYRWYGHSPTRTRLFARRSQKVRSFVPHLSPRAVTISLFLSRLRPIPLAASRLVRPGRRVKSAYFRASGHLAFNDMPHSYRNGDLQIESFMVLGHKIALIGPTRFSSGTYPTSLRTRLSLEFSRLSPIMK